MGNSNESQKKEEGIETIFNIKKKNNKNIKRQSCYQKPNLEENKKIFLKNSIKLKNGNLYNGNLINKIPNGKGHEIYKNGDFYIGYYKRGRKEGLGEFHCNNKYIYIGNYKNDLFDGFGVMIFSNGIRNYGKWKFGKQILDRKLDELNFIRNDYGVMK